ncbi:CheR family methyltransferase [Robbsia sp. KACC 23696]|uniref:CheR family methyltransferase n=1 Tax=Robbsia sp. KACC 23696 TaxID=3149231 RepID=UPI00325A8013
MNESNDLFAGACAATSLFRIAVMSGAAETWHAVMVVSDGGIFIRRDLACMEARILLRNLPDHAADITHVVDPAPALLTHDAASSSEGDTRSVAAATTVDFEPVFHALAAAGSEFRGYKRGTLERRIARRMSVNQVATFKAYCQMLRDQTAEAEALGNDMMIGVTAFFRDPEAWDVIVDSVLRPLLDAPDQEAPLRIWVPGCATGEEAYSMAMVLTEEIGKRATPRRFIIFATDLNRAALVHARIGLYPASSVQSLGEARLARFFIRSEEGFQVSRTLRASILFNMQNLISDPPFSRIDLISCRNLLIYLESDAQQRAFSLFHFALNPQGYLFLGRSESTDPDTTRFQELSKPWRIYQRSPTVKPRVLRHRFSATMVSQDHFGKASRAMVRNKGYAELVNTTLLADQRAAILVNGAHHVLYVSGAADRYLGQPDGEPTNHVLDMARERLRLKLRIALRRVVQHAETRPVSEVVPADGAPGVRITVSNVQDSAQAAGSVLLIVFECLATIESSVLPVIAPGSHSDLWHLESELRTTQAALGSTIEDLEESNSELRVSNEEILSMNEEFRSANEELETSKEALQVVNEQLNQVNARLEQKIQQLEALTDDFTNLLASTEIATILIDRYGLLKRFTPSAARMFALSPLHEGCVMAEIFGDAPGDTILQDVERVLACASEQAEREVKFDAGQWYVRRITPYMTSLGKFPAGAVVTWTDITHIKKMDERAWRLAAVVQDSNDAITVFDMSGRFLAWNKAASVMYGYTETEALTMSVSDLVPAGAREDHLDFIRQALGNEALHSYETRRVAKDGRELDVWLSMSILLDEEGKAVSISSTERDLTDRSISNAFLRQRAEQLALADRRKNEFLAMLGHELRNPLAALLSAGSLLSLTSVAEAKKTWAAGVIVRQGRAMLHLVNDMLDIARIAAGHVELHRQHAPLSGIVQSAIEVCQPIIDEQRHRLAVSLPKEAVYLFADATRLSQVIENLLINAAKFTPPGGVIKLRARTNAAHRLVLHIEDNGKGIAPERINRIFDMFVQGKAPEGQRYNGLGVGLSVVRRLVELHGGTVRAISDGRTGSTFIVDLPLAVQTHPATLAETVSEAVRPTCRRVLIIDDNRDAGDALSVLLTHEGHEVQTAADGPSGLAIAQVFLPEVVLLDIGLPGMDGYAVAAQLRANDATRHALLVAVTGFGMPSDRQRSAEAGLDQHLIKPVDCDKLCRLLASGKGSGGGEEPIGEAEA